MYSGQCVMWLIVKNDNWPRSKGELKRTKIMSCRMCTYSFFVFFNVSMCLHIQLMASFSEYGVRSDPFNGLFALLFGWMNLTNCFWMLSTVSTERCVQIYSLFFFWYIESSVNKHLYYGTVSWAGDTCTRTHIRSPKWALDISKQNHKHRANLKF